MFEEQDVWHYTETTTWDLSELCSGQWKVRSVNVRSYGWNTQSVQKLFMVMVQFLRKGTRNVDLLIDNNKNPNGSKWGLLIKSLHDVLQVDLHQHVHAFSLCHGAVTDAHSARQLFRSVP